MKYLVGCYIHGHYENCLKHPNATKSSTNFLKKTYEQLTDEHLKKLELLKTNNPNEVEKVYIHWECFFEDSIKDNEDFKRFKSIYHEHPLVRLKPRTVVRAGINEIFALKWSKTIAPTETFYCLDINGLYSFISVKFPMFVGKYDILIGSELTKIKIKENKLYFNDKPMYGTIQLKIAPPPNLFIPFLLYRRKCDNQSVLTLCSKCAENMSKLNCKHSNDERSITSTYFISEIEFALKIGYKILAIYEVHNYLLIYKTIFFLRLGLFKL